MVWVDGGYGGQLLEWVAAKFKFSLAVVLRPKQTRRFVLLPRRWVVERTFGWLNHCRRLSKSYEQLTQTDEAWVYIAISRIHVESFSLAREFPNSLSVCSSIRFLRLGARLSLFSCDSIPVLHCLFVTVEGLS